MTEAVVSANEFRTKLDMDPVKPKRHRLVIWPSGANPWPGGVAPADSMITFKCVKCSKGVLTISAGAVREMIKGNAWWKNYLEGVAWGSWGICREDLPQHLERS